jgi:hypothetical protein
LSWAPSTIISQGGDAIIFTIACNVLFLNNFDLESSIRGLNQSRGTYLRWINKTFSLGATTKAQLKEVSVSVWPLHVSVAVMFHETQQIRFGEEA